VGLKELCRAFVAKTQGRLQTVVDKLEEQIDIATDNVRDEVKELDAKQRSDYDQRFAAMEKRLTELEQRGRKGRNKRAF
jgi:gas vesicle protein